MRGNRLAIRWRATLAIVSVPLFVISTWAATQEKVPHNSNPNSTGDAASNRRGTTNEGGTYYSGTVFELTPEASGNWTEKVLGHVGRSPSPTGFVDENGALISDAAGNLYGTTEYGGTYGCGVAFELTPESGGSWTEKVLHSFGDSTDGISPSQAGLIFDAAGNLYGTTSNKQGTVFELTPTKDGGWTEKILHSFNGTDGGFPFAGLTIDAAGNLYGTTYEGGTYNSGTVFELTPTKGGGWTEKVLHSFGNGADGAVPYAGLTIDAAGNLYGTTLAGGIHHVGTVFELTPTKGEGWTEKVLHSFGNGADGAFPRAGLIFDSAGNLYGTTSQGGAYNSCMPTIPRNNISTCGTVFELTPKAGGRWTERVLYSFNHNGTDGYDPLAGLIFAAAGNLYGTTSMGGSENGRGCFLGCGTVFELTPTKGGGWTEKVVHNFDGTDGVSPSAGLIIDAAGNLYGTTNEHGIWSGAH